MQVWRRTVDKNKSKSFDRLWPASSAAKLTIQLSASQKSLHLVSYCVKVQYLFGKQIVQNWQLDTNGVHNWEALKHKVRFLEK